MRRAERIGMTRQHLRTGGERRVLAATQQGVEPNELMSTARESQHLAIERFDGIALESIAEQDHARVPTEDSSPPAVIEFRKTSP